MTKKYKMSDLDVHTYGSGANKGFIIYTDFKRIDGEGPKWYTRVYPDIEGNKGKAIKQALKWLNTLYPSEPWIYREKPRKISITYNQLKEAPKTFYETDEKGIDLASEKKLY